VKARRLLIARNAVALARVAVASTTAARPGHALGALTLGGVEAAA